MIIDNTGEIKLYYHKMHPGLPVEPWSLATSASRCATGPNGSKLALIICHDGMFPRDGPRDRRTGRQRHAAHGGIHPPIRQSWRFTNQSDAFCSLMYTASVTASPGPDGSFNSMGEGMIVNYDGTPLATGKRHSDEIITGEVAAHM